MPGFWDCALCLCVLCMDGRWSTWVVRVGAPSKIFNPIPNCHGWECGPSAFHSEFILICVGLLLCFLKYIFSKPLRLLQMYIFQSR